MSALLDWSPGQRIVAIALVVFGAVTVVSIVALIAAWRLKRRPALSHLVLLSALVTCTIIPPVTASFAYSDLSFVKLRVLPVEEKSQSSPRKPAGTRGATSNRDGLTRFGPVEESADEMPPTDVTRNRQTSGTASLGLTTPRFLKRTATIVLLIWLTGFAYFAIRIVVGWTNLLRLRRTLRPASAPVLTEVSRDVARFLALKQQPTIAVSDAIRTPIAIGVVRPTIVLPTSMLGVLTRDELRDVLMHETAHVMGRDNFFQWLQVIVAAVFWPVASVHLMNRTLNRVREEVRDNAVLKVRDAVSYCETLLRLAELGSGEVARMGTVGILHWRGKLEIRILELIHGRRDTMTKAGFWTTLGVVALFATTGAMLCGTGIAGDVAPAAAAADEAATSKTSLVANKPRRSFQLEFEGTEYVVIPKLKYDGSHPITLEAMMTPYPRDDETKRSSVVGNLELSGVGIHYKYKQVLFHVNDGGEANYGYHSAGSDKELKPDRAVHVAAVFDGKQLKLFVDGKLQKHTDMIGEKHKASPFHFMVGADPSPKGRPHQFFSGLIDEVRISKTARYSKDFKPARRFKPDKNTLVLYHFDAGTGIIAKDSSGNGRDGVIHGAGWIKEAAVVPQK